MTEAAEIVKALSPRDKARLYVLIQHAKGSRDGREPQCAMTAEAIDLVWNAALKVDGDGMQELINENARYGREVQGVYGPGSAHYDVDCHAAEVVPGVWVAWWHLSGGGKHGQPALYDWIGNAFDIECETREVMTKVYDFKIPTKAEGGK